jgi:hypothetical protein
MMTTTAIVSSNSSNANDDTIVRDEESGMPSWMLAIIIGGGCLFCTLLIVGVACVVRRRGDDDNTAMSFAVQQESADLAAKPPGYDPSPYTRIRFDTDYSSMPSTTDNCAPPLPQPGAYSRKISASVISTDSSSLILF